jgi:hypothetical protein
VFGGDSQMIFYHVGFPPIFYELTIVESGYVLDCNQIANVGYDMNSTYK